jgi:hypothetical protein
MQTNHNNVGALIGGAILIGIGLLTLVSRIFTDIDWGLLWPVSIIAFGALFFIAMFAMGKSGAPFAVPGTIITGIGLVVLLQNITRHWTTMSYLWTLVITFVGLGIYIMGRVGEDANQKRAGAKVMKIGIILCIVFGAIFETVFSSLNTVIFPILLILLGGYLVLSRSGLLSSKQEKSIDTPLPPTS